MRSTSLALLAIGLLASCTPEKEYLFNGENLDGWTIFVGDSTVNPEEFFYVNDGMIETVGVPNGYLRTLKEYSNYHLHLEWRYPENPVNSGVFLHTSGPDLKKMAAKIAPKSILPVHSIAGGEFTTYHDNVIYPKRGEKHVI